MSPVVLILEKIGVSFNHGTLIKTIISELNENY